MKNLIPLLLIPLVGCQATPSGADSNVRPSVAHAVRLTAPGADVGRTMHPQDFLPWKLSVVPSADGGYEIHVSDAMGHEFQVIEGPTTELPFTVESLLTIKDYNADGWPDIAARSLPVGASAITGEVLFVYDVVAKRFRESDEIAQEGEIQTAAPGCITVEFLNPDNTTYSKDAYCWREDRWAYKGRETE